MHKTNLRKSTLAVALLAILISGCKGGSGGSDLSGDNSNNNTSSSATPAPGPTPTPPASKINLASSVNYAEPVSGSETKYIEVTLSEALTNNLALSVSTENINARSEGQFKNYEPQTVSPFTIAAGLTRAQLPITINNNNLYENDVSLKVTIRAAQSSDYVIEGNESVVTITDSDGMPAIRFEKTKRTLIEGDQDTFTAELSHYSHLDASVVLQQSGSVSEGDFVSGLDASNKLTITAETLQQSFTVTAQDDGISEGAESIVYTMTSPTDTTIDAANQEMSIYIPGDKRFNDTGFVTRFDGTNFDNTDVQSTYPNQDADYGLDTEQPANHEDGQHGFSYSKFDVHGNSININETTYACIRDNRSGLYIQNKDTGAVTLPTQDQVEAEQKAQRDDPDNYNYPYVNESSKWQHISYLYTWYEPDDELNGGSQGADNDVMPEKVPVDVTCAVSENSGRDRRCDSAGYISQMNQFAICGIDDWRLPTPAEAKSFINYDVNAPQAANNQFFDFLNNQLILTSATNAERNGSVWCVDSESGQAKLCLKGSFNTIIAVSGGRE